jgi:Tol biopolymer transport system component
MTDLPPYRAEPDAEFADRLERELLSRLTDPALATLTEVALVTDVPETDADVAEPDLQAADRRRRPSRIRLVAGGLVAAGLVAVLALVVRNGGDSEPAVAPPAANGLIAFAGNPGGGSAQSDIFVVAPDGTGLQALTSTPELAEYAPAWSPDGSRLAFVRTDLPSAPHLRDCTPNCEFVVVDPATGVETFSADIPETEGAATWVPVSVAWSSDGGAVVARSIACDVAGCGASPSGGGMNSVIADLETGALTTFTPPHQAMRSPDGEWFSLAQASIVHGPALQLVPADVIGTGDVVDAAALSGVRPVPERPGDDAWGVPQWMPDSSAMVVTAGRSESVSVGLRIDVVTVADGQRRTLIEDGFDPAVSPDGSQIAYLRGSMSADVNEIWVAVADGSDPRRVTVSSTAPVWSPDGSLLVASDADGWFTVRPDGTGRTQITPFMLPDARAGCCPDYRPSWQPLPLDSSVPEPTAPATAAASTTTAATSPEVVSTPVSELKRWLVERSDEVAFVVSGPTTSYWRLGALSDFNGTTWGMPDTSLTAITGPLPSGLEPGVDGETVTYTFELTGLDGALLPAAYIPVRLEGQAAVAFDAEGFAFVATSGTSDGLVYTVDSLLPRYDPAGLRAADATPTGSRAEHHLALPADFSAALGDQARLITADAPTRYDQAIALQNWLRGFTYDESTPAGHSQTAMVEFIEQERGYCEQFAGTFAALARVVGLPSRVAVGFTPGEQGPDGRYYVQFKHAHAWPEIYFEGIGWVPFEPTPGRGNPAASESNGVPAAQIDDGGE